MVGAMDRLDKLPHRIEDLPKRFIIEDRPKPPVKVTKPLPPPKPKKQPRKQPRKEMARHTYKLYEQGHGYCPMESWQNRWFRRTGNMPTLLNTKRGPGHTVGQPNGRPKREPR